MNKFSQTRKYKIKLLQDIASGNATIEDLNPWKFVYLEENGTYTYNGKTITKEEISKIKSAVPPIIFLRCEEGL